MTAPARLYKVLGPDQQSCRGGTGHWTPGRWRSVRGPLEPCKRGIHAVTLDYLPQWLGPEIWAFESRPGTEAIEAGDKWVVRSGRITTRYEGWNERTSRLFACDCAEHVLPLFERANPADPRPRQAIAVARRFAAGAATREDLARASAAAGDATGAAANAAVGDAASAAAIAAAKDTAWATVWEAANAAWEAARWARGTAWAAVWEADNIARNTDGQQTIWVTVAVREAAAAARDAEQRWQTARLAQYLDGAP